MQKSPNFIFADFEKMTSFCKTYCRFSMQEKINFYLKYSCCYVIFQMSPTQIPPKVSVQEGFIKTLAILVLNTEAYFNHRCKFSFLYDTEKGNLYS